MSRVRPFILALLLLLGYGSGALRAVHEMSHALLPADARSASSAPAGHSCGGVNCGSHGSSSETSGASAPSDGESSHAPNGGPTGHQECSLCEFLANSAPLDVSPPPVLALADRCVGLSLLGDEEAPKRLLARAGDARAPPRG